MERSFAIFGTYGLVVLALAISLLISPYQRAKFDFSSEQIRKILIKTFFIYCVSVFIVSAIQHFPILDFVKSLFSSGSLLAPIKEEAQLGYILALGAFECLVSIVSHLLFFTAKPEDKILHFGSPAFLGLVVVLYFRILAIIPFYFSSLYYLLRDSTSSYSINWSRNRSYWNILRSKTNAYPTESFVTGVKEVFSTQARLKGVDESSRWYAFNTFELEVLGLLYRKVKGIAERKFEFVKVLIRLRLNKVPHQWIDLVSSNFHMICIGTMSVEERDKNSEILHDLHIEMLRILVTNSGGHKKFRFKTLFKNIQKFFVLAVSLTYQPFMSMRLIWLKDYAWNNSEDMLYQLYTAQIPSSTHSSYKEFHEDAVGVVDKNRQPKMVSIQLENGSIYRGWPVNTYAPHNSDREFTILPYETWMRKEDGKVIKVTNYEDLIWGKLRRDLAVLLSLGAEFYLFKTRKNVAEFLKYIRTDADLEERLKVKKFYENELKSTVSALQLFIGSYCNWIVDSFQYCVYKSDGFTHEVTQLLAKFPKEAESHFKSIKIDDVVIIHPFEPAIQPAFDEVEN